MTDVFDGIAKISGTVVWPVAVVVAVLLFRGPVARLIDRIDKIKGGPVDLATQPRPQQPTAVSAGVTLDRPTAGESWAELKSNPILGPLAVKLEADVAKQADEDRVPWLAGILTRTLLNFWYEAVYRSIFGSQIRILDRVNVVVTLSMDSAREMFAAAAAKFPEAHKDRSFDAWIGWLVAQELLVVDGTVIRAGRLMQDFLQFLPRRGLSMSKLG